MDKQGIAYKGIQINTVCFIILILQFNFKKPNILYNYVLYLYIKFSNSERNNNYCVIELYILLYYYVDAFTIWCLNNLSIVSNLLSREIWGMKE